MLSKVLFSILVQVGMALVVTACGPQARPVPSDSPVPSAVSAGPATATPSAAMGFLEGKASIGPLQPVERVGVPPPTPSPANCTARGLVVFDSQTGIEATSFDLGPDCTYQIGLSPGTYRVELQRRGIDRSKDLPRTVTIYTGQTTRLDISIDTGIR
jgi:hypothetical protein